MKIKDPEVRILAAISQALKVEYIDDDRSWEDSPFGWIRLHPSRKRGAIGEKLVAGWLASRDFNISRSPDSDADRIVEGKRVEIKFSTLWASGGYKFQQLRDQNYDIAVCLGIRPFDANCWVLPKADILRLWKDEQIIRTQHGGANGADTAWLAFQADDPPEWLSKYGGTLSDGLRVLSDLTGFQVSEIHEESAEYGKTWKNKGFDFPEDSDQIKDAE